MDMTTCTTVIVYTRRYRIDGKVSPMPGARFTDDMRSAPASRPFRASFIELVVPGD